MDSSIETLIGFSEAAAKKARQLIEEEANASLNLRVFVTGGGCSGFEYGFTFDEDLEEDDTATLESYMQEYFGKILKKLRETSYQQSQKSDEISFL